MALALRVASEVGGAEKLSIGDGGSSVVSAEGELTPEGAERSFGKHTTFLWVYTTFQVQEEPSSVLSKVWVTFMGSF